MIDLLGTVKYSPVILHFVVEFVLLMYRFSWSFFFFFSLQVLSTSISFLVLYLFGIIRLDIYFK